MKTTEPEKNEEELELLFEKAYMRACELDSPNSYDFDKLVDEIYEKFKNEYIEKKETNNEPYHQVPHT